jgi:ABC-type sugar transport system permease subunit
MNAAEFDLESTLVRLKSRKAIPFYFIFPFFLVWTVFYLYPLLWAIWLSFNNYSFTGLQFVGLDHYAAILSPGSQFVRSVWITGFIAIMVVPIQVVLSLVFAVLLNSEYTKFVKILRSAYILPLAISTVVMASFLALLLNRNGIVNLFLIEWVGLRISWITDPFAAKVSVAITHSWRTMGLFVIIFLAGLQSVPPNLYRAAKMDGANRLQAFRHITVPQLRPIIVLVSILSTYRAVQMFAIPWVLTNGGPGFETHTVVVLLYREAFENTNIGFAAAIAVVFSIIVMSLYIIQYQFAGGADDE